MYERSSASWGLLQRESFAGSLSRCPAGDYRLEWLDDGGDDSGDWPSLFG